MFCNFCEKFENSKWPPYLAIQKFFENWHGYSAEISCRVKNFVEIALSSTVFKITAFLCFTIFEKNSKIQNGRHFFFLKIGIATLQRYPVGQKFCRNRSISHGFQDISIFVFSYLQNS